MKSRIFLICIALLSLAATPSLASQSGPLGGIVGGVVRGVIVRKTISVGTKAVIRNFGPRLLGLAERCVMEKIPGALKGQITQTVIQDLVEAYVMELQSNTGHQIGSNQKTYIQNEFAKPLQELQGQAYKDARAVADSKGSKVAMRAGWSHINGQNWPSVKQTVGGIITSIKADIHHILPIKQNGAPSIPLNAIPALRPNVHQKIIHAKDGMLETLLSCMRHR